MRPRPPRPHQLLDAPELGLVAVLHVALDALETELVIEHHTLDDPGPRPPPSLHHAVLLRSLIRALRTELHVYRRSVLRALRTPRRRPRQELLPY